MEKSEMLSLIKLVEEDVKNQCLAIEARLRMSETRSISIQKIVDQNGGGLLKVLCSLFRPTWFPRVEEMLREELRALKQTTEMINRLGLIKGSVAQLVKLCQDDPTAKIFNIGKSAPAPIEEKVQTVLTDASKAFIAGTQLQSSSVILSIYEAKPAIVPEEPKVMPVPAEASEHVEISKLGISPELNSYYGEKNREKYNTDYLTADWKGKEKHIVRHTTEIPLRSSEPILEVPVQQDLRFQPPAVEKIVEKVKFVPARRKAAPAPSQEVVQPMLTVQPMLAVQPVAAVQPMLTVQPVAKVALDVKTRVTTQEAAVELGMSPGLFRTRFNELIKKNKLPEDTVVKVRLEHRKPQNSYPYNLIHQVGLAPKEKRRSEFYSMFKSLAHAATMIEVPLKEINHYIDTGHARIPENTRLVTSTLSKWNLNPMIKNVWELEVGDEFKFLTPNFKGMTVNEKRIDENGKRQTDKRSLRDLYTESGETPIASSKGFDEDVRLDTMLSTLFKVVKHDTDMVMVLKYSVPQLANLDLTKDLAYKEGELEFNLDILPKHNVKVLIRS